MMMVSLTMDMWPLNVPHYYTAISFVWMMTLIKQLTHPYIILSIFQGF